MIHNIAINYIARKDMYHQHNVSSRRSVRVGLDREKVKGRGRCGTKSNNQLESCSLVNIGRQR
jgi:hypothetical protein